MTDSPAGLAGWIAEKFRTWSDCGGEIANAIEIDALLANIFGLLVLGEYRVVVPDL
jgi:microsomal epoxide hydrolase